MKCLQRITGVIIVLSLLASLLPLALVALHPVHAAAATGRTLTIAPMGNPVLRNLIPKFS